MTDARPASRQAAYDRAASALRWWGWTSAALWIFGGIDSEALFVLVAMSGVFLLFTWRTAGELRQGRGIRWSLRLHVVVLLSLGFFLSNVLEHGPVPGRMVAAMTAPIILGSGSLVATGKAYTYRRPWLEQDRSPAAMRAHHRFAMVVAVVGAGAAAVAFSGAVADHAHPFSCARTAIGALLVAGLTIVAVRDVHRGRNVTLVALPVWITLVAACCIPVALVIAGESPVVWILPAALSAYGLVITSRATIHT